MFVERLLTFPIALFDLMAFSLYNADVVHGTTQEGDLHLKKIPPYTLQLRMYSPSPKLMRNPRHHR